MLPSINPQIRPDGRQSQTAAAIQKGVCRHLRAAGFATLTECSLASGRRVDVLGLSPSGQIWIVEIKSSLEDFRADLKWPEYRDFCDRLYFAITTDLEPDIMPAEAGLIIADGWGAEIQRDPAEHLLHASRREAMTLSFARAAARRLHGLYDPEMM